MKLSQKRIDEIKRIVSHFPTVVAENKVDMRKPAEIVDVKPMLKELLTEVESLNDEVVERKDNERVSHELFEAASKDIEVLQKDNKNLKKVLNEVKEIVALIAEGESSDENVYKAMGQSAFSKIENIGEN